MTETKENIKMEYLFSVITTVIFYVWTSDFAGH